MEQERVMLYTHKLAFVKNNKIEYIISVSPEFHNILLDEDTYIYDVSDIENIEIGQIYENIE